MKTEWDYTNLAKAYLKRADYSQDAIDTIIDTASLDDNDDVCDVGAGVAHLTLMLARAKLNVHSVEPNDEMRKYGIMRTEQFKNVTWSEGVGENTGQKPNTFKLVTFGSSFNVCDRLAALAEVKRIGKPNAWFAAMWNHRDLHDPIQAKIESIISHHLPEYGYGTRREDQTEIINQSGLFSEVYRFDGKVAHMQKIGEMVEAWRSHATLERQAGTKFSYIIDDIQSFLSSLDQQEVIVPYTTNVWMAQLK